MLKEENVINYYVLCNKLKNVVRTGWVDWNVKRDRIESVAEHIFGVQMLALAMYSEYSYDIDIYKVLYMLAIHEIGEALIGDLTLFDISSCEKKIIEHEAVEKILSPLLKKEEINSLFSEFDNHQTKEAIFAYQCDKLECDLQCKLYDEENCVDIKNRSADESKKNDLVKNLLLQTNSWSKMWLLFGQEIYPYDENFKSVSNFAIENDISARKLKKRDNNEGI